MSFKIKLINDGKVPTRGSEFAAGYDCYANKDFIIPKGTRALIPLGIIVAIPKGYYGRLAPRSGLSVKKNIDVGAGVIDEDFRAELFALLINNGNEDFIINRYDRIIQLILEKITTPDIIIVEELEETIRGTNGFGSTGI
jgi:dUTP pyrophosphatase